MGDTVPQDYLELAERDLETLFAGRDELLAIVADGPSEALAASDAIAMLQGFTGVWLRAVTECLSSY